MLKIAFASQTEHNFDPAKILTEINVTLRGKIEQSFVTACCMYVDTANGKLHYANAGHPAPIVWGKSKSQLHQCPSTGMILGPFPNSVYENSTLDLGRGDRLLLYTDGIVEARNRAEDFFGEERLIAFMESHASEAADRVADELIAHISKWSGRSRQKSHDDDLTLVIVDIVAEPAES
jgi:serine phosphatase RsbU (regulator of sigma subunit)